MSFHVDNFIDEGLKYGGASGQLFNVSFHELDERLKYLICRVEMTHTMTDTLVAFSIMEDEDHIVWNNLFKLDNRMMVLTEYARDGRTISIYEGRFQFASATTVLDWGGPNKDIAIKKWIVKGNIVALEM